MSAAAADILVDDLSFDTTVPCSLVHVRGLSEVFISDHRRLSERRFVTALQITRSHQLWGDRQVSFHDPVITLEIGRQTVFLVVHHYLGIPTSWKFVLNRVEFRVVDLEAYRDDRRVPPQGTAHVQLVNRRDRHGLFEAGFEGDVCLHGVPAMTMSADITAMSPYNYRLLRAYGRGSKPIQHSPPPPGPQRLPTAMVGRGDPRNVVLHEQVDECVAARTLRFRLVIDQDHPGFFDHPHDHVTGSLILEFFRQSAIATANRMEALPPQDLVVVGCSTRFKEFAELDAVTECVARVAEAPLGRAVVDLELWQAGARIAWAQLCLQDVGDEPEVAPSG